MLLLLIIWSFSENGLFSPKLVGTAEYGGGNSMWTTNFDYSESEFVTENF